MDKTIVRPAENANPAPQKEVIGPIQMDVTENGKLDLVGCLKDWKKMERTFGTKNPAAGAGLLFQACGIAQFLAVKDEGGKAISKRLSLDMTMAAIHGIEPKGQLEGMLAVQMVAVHNLAMRFMGIAANNSNKPTISNTYVEMATKMSRTFTAQIEALNRLRGKGTQKVVVEHVTVNQGGQAIVGQVNHSKGGGPQG